MFEEYQGKFIQFYLRKNEAGIADISGIVEDVNVVTMPNGVVEVIFILDTQQNTTYELPYRTVAFMVVSRITESGGGVGEQIPQGKSLGITTSPSQYAKNLIKKRDPAQTEESIDKNTESASLGEERQPVRRVDAESMQVD